MPGNSNNGTIDEEHIPFNRPSFAGKELEYISEAVRHGHTAGSGPFTEKCQRFLEERLGAKKVFLTTSCTTAMEMAASLARVGPGHEVVLPSFTFPSTANAFMIWGARPVFVDIRADTLNMDETLLEAAVSTATRAIVPVHYAGVACEMDTILALAKKQGVPVVEDAAQGINCFYKGSCLGTIADFGAFSFHETKNVICGEGGALCVNREDAVSRAEVIRDKGTNRARFFRGEVDKYTWVDIGSSYLPSDILAAFLWAQLEHLDQITTERLERYSHYNELLAPLEERGLLRRPIVPDECIHSGHLYRIIVENETTRNRLLQYLQSRGVLAVIHYVPLHLAPMGESLGYRRGQLPVTEDVCSRLVRLPLFRTITPGQQERVVSLICEFFGLASGPHPC